MLQTSQPCNTSPAARAVLPRTSQYFLGWPYYLWQAPVLTYAEGHRGGNLCWTGLFTQSNGIGPLAKQAGPGLPLCHGCPGDLAEGRALRKVEGKRNREGSGEMEGKVLRGREVKGEGEVEGKALRGDGKH